MNEATARARLERMTAHNVVPVLDTLEIDDLLAQARRVDTDGLEPDDDDWTPTYDLNWAAAEGWEWKAGKCSNLELYTSGTDATPDTVRQACMAQADRYRERITASIPNVDPNALTYYAGELIP